MRHHLLFCLACLLGLNGLQAQPLQHPFSHNDSTWYNRKTGISRYLIAILDGDPQKAIAQARAQGPDAEADYLQAIAYAHLDQADSALHFVAKSLEKRLPPERYLTGDPAFLRPLRALPGFETAVAEASQLVHGPMLGAAEPRSMKVWLRTAAELPVTVELSRTPGFERVRRFYGRTEAAREFTATIELSGLQPQTRYHYRLRVGDQAAGPVYAFTTPPLPGQGSRFIVVFGGGAAFIPWHHHMWSAIAAHQPDALFMLGDNVYIDYPERPQVQQYCYHRRQSEPHWRRLVAQTAVYAIWDDHDFGDNDEYGTPDPDQPAWKRPVLALFKNQWVDPGYGGDTGMPGVFFRQQIGEAEFFFLDGRYYRQPSFVGEKPEAPLSMLGEAQKAWLKQALKASTAKFKVLVSPVPWAFDAKPQMEGRIDTWGGYQEERNELFSFLAEEKIAGVFLLSADRHRSDLWKIEREAGYPLYEFESSRLTNTHYHRVMPGSVFGYNQTNSFGKLIFDTTSDEPVVHYEIYSIENALIHRFSLPLSQLR